MFGKTNLFKHIIIELVFTNPMISFFVAFVNSLQTMQIYFVSINK